jgi:ATP synthase protein I
MQTADALQAKRILQVQAILGTIAAALALPFGGTVAVSVLLGAGTCLLANALFAAWVFRGYRAQEPERLVLRIYAAEAVKIALILGAFGLAFATIETLNVPALLAAYLVTQVASNLIAAQMGTRSEIRPADRNKK